MLHGIKTFIDLIQCLINRKIYIYKKLFFFKMNHLLMVTKKIFYN